MGGYEVIQRGLMRRLREDGHQVRVLVTDYRRPDVGRDAAEDPDVHRELGWYWRDHDWPRLTVLERLRLERRNARIFDRHLREFEPDVVTWWALGGISIGLLERARRAGLPGLLFVLDPWPAYGPERDQWTWMWHSRPRAARLAEWLTGLPTRPALASAGRWLFCSASMREQTLRLGLPITDQALLAPGVEAELLAVPREPEPPGWRWRLLYVGRVVEQKGVRTAIEALAQLPAEATLRIVGDGDEPYRRELEQLAGRLGVGDRVRFEPQRPHHEVIEVYRAADLVVFPVVWPEPWGLVPLEAMALGRPVVATGRGGSSDFLRDGENTLLFEAGDAAGLTRALRRVAEDSDLRGRLLEDGYRTAAAHSEDEFNRSAVEEIRAAAAQSPRRKR
jgi:glycosyltransferase involved in cell wall biosynthesis